MEFKAILLTPDEYDYLLTLVDKSNVEGKDFIKSAITKGTETFKVSINDFDLTVGGDCE